jgi:hypothetical protein
MDRNDQASHSVISSSPSLRKCFDTRWPNRAKRGCWARYACSQVKTGHGLSNPAVRVGLGVALVLSLPLVAMLLSDDVVWSLGDFVAAGVLLATIGVVIELAARRKGNLVVVIGIAVIGVAAAVFGEADDAPGLVLLGLLLIAGACVLGVRTAQRRS